MKTRYFAEALRAVIGQLQKTYEEFARAVGLSQPMISKLVAGKPAQRVTYRKILNYFEKEVDPRAKEMRQKLWQAFLADIASDFASASDSLPAEIHIAAKKKQLAGRLFVDMSAPVIRALVVLGSAAMSGDLEHNLLMIHAARLCEEKKQTDLAHFFTAQVRSPSKSKSWTILGGSEGSLMLALSETED